MNKQNMSVTIKEKPNKEKRKTLLTIMIIDIIIFVIVLLLLLLLLIFKNNQNNDPYIKVRYALTNEVINEDSSLNPDLSFTYVSDSEEEIVFSSSGPNVSIGTYNPHSYIYGTSDTSLYISFTVKNKEIYNLEYEYINVCDIDGNNVITLNKDDYTLENNKLTYSSSLDKYIYSLSLTYKIKK